MGYKWGLTEAPVASESPAVVQFLRWRPRHRWAMRWYRGRIRRLRARRASRASRGNP